MLEAVFLKLNALVKLVPDSFLVLGCSSSYLADFFETSVHLWQSKISQANPLKVYFTQMLHTLGVVIKNG